MISGNDLMYLAVLLLFKHMVAEFFYQPPWMLSRKGRLLAGGLEAHAGLHVLLSAMVFAWFGETRTDVLITILAFEFFVHYWTDYFKVKINQMVDLRPDESEYWMVFGLDQFIHGVTMVIMVQYALTLAK